MFSAPAWLNFTIEKSTHRKFTMAIDRPQDVLRGSLITGLCKRNSCSRRKLEKENIMYRKLVFLSIVSLLLSACNAAPAPTKTVMPVIAIPTDLPPTSTSLPPTVISKPPTATPKPLARPAASRYELVYEPDMKQILMIGSKSSSIDVWLYDVNNNKLTRMKDRPSIKILCLDYDANAKGVVTNNQNTGISWFFDPAKDEWRELAKSQSYSSDLPCSMVYSPVSDKQVVLSRGKCISSSGSGDCGYLSATLLYDYSANSWTKLDLDPSPPELCGIDMAYDSESDRILLWDGAVVKRMWALNLKKNTWEELAATNGPTKGGAGVGMVYVPGLDRTFVYYEDQFFAYDYNANTWEKAKGELKPGSRILHSTTYDPVAKKIILYGGTSASGEELNDLWLYDPQTGEWVMQQLP
jgi:hypothetical protein